SPSVKTSPPIPWSSRAVASSWPLTIAISPAPAKIKGPGACGMGWFGDGGPGTCDPPPGEGPVGDLLHCANNTLITTALRQPSATDLKFRFRAEALRRPELFQTGNRIRT